MDEEERKRKMHDRVDTSPASEEIDLFLLTNGRRSLVSENQNDVVVS